MLLVSVACLVALGLTLVAVYREQPQTDPDVVAPRAPLPSADDARVEFPVRPFGYAPAAVDTAYEALRLDYADLLAEAPPDVVERARRRAALRAGVEEPPHDEASRGEPAQEQPGRDRPAQEQPPRDPPSQERPVQGRPAQERTASTVIPAQWPGGESSGEVVKPAGRGRVGPKRVG